MSWETDIRKVFESKISPEPNSGCWLWTGPTLQKRGGYGVLTHRPSMTHMMRAHRLSWMLHHGKITEEQHVLHKCDNVICVNPDHLFLGNQTENMLDKCKKKRQQYGNKHPGYKHGKYVGDKRNPKYWSTP